MTELGSPIMGDGLHLTHLSSPPGWKAEACLHLSCKISLSFLSTFTFYDFSFNLFMKSNIGNV